ncbi:MAG: hypothetical protein HY808_12335 [Nitrospirae bacterium]|nr:hypothetical protein [Nitrospirota bacterium]
MTAGGQPADAAGRIFVGNKDSRNVEVYNPGLTLLFKLGTGDGEFTQPNDMAIDSALNSVSDKCCQ